MHLGVGCVDELCASLAPLPICETVAADASTDAVSRFQHRHLDTRVDEVDSAAQTSQTRSDDDHTRRWHAVSSIFQNNVGCSGLITRGTPDHGTKLSMNTHVRR